MRRSGGSVQVNVDGIVTFRVRAAEAGLRVRHVASVFQPFHTDIFLIACIGEGDAFLSACSEHLRSAIQNVDGILSVGQFGNLRVYRHPGIVGGYAFLGFGKGAVTHALGQPLDADDIFVVAVDRQLVFRVVHEHDFIISGIAFLSICTNQHDGIDGSVHGVGVFEYVVRVAIRVALHGGFRRVGSKHLIDFGRLGDVRRLQAKGELLAILSLMIERGNGSPCTAVADAVAVNLHFAWSFG